MGFLHRFRTKQRVAAGESDEDIRLLMDEMQPIHAPAEELLPQLVADLAAACVAHPELKAVYVFESAFGGEGEAVVTVGLVLDDASDPELFVTINEAIRPEVERLVQGGDYIFQRLDEYSLDRVTGRVSPIFERE